MIYKNSISKRPQVLGASKTGPSVANAVVKASNPTQMATQMGILGSGGDVIGFTMANGTASTVTYVIGDADGAVASQLSKTAVNPTASDAFSPAIFKSRFATRPVQVQGLNLQTSSDAAEFSQRFEYGWVENDGTATSKPLRFGVFASPSDQDKLIRPVNLQGLSQEVVLGPDSGLFFPVIGNETLIAYIVMGQQTK
jgi:hypothetical protein